LSRNFELLSQLEGPEENRSATIAHPPQTATADINWKPALRMNDPVRIEVSRLVDNLFRLQPSAPRVVAFTAPESNVGCSWLCARVAETLAVRVQETICVVDCNVHSPNIHRQFHIHNHRGLADALNQSEPMRKYVQALSRSNLFVVSGGSAASNAQSKLVSDGMRERLTELKELFDYLVLDIASLDISRDAMILGRWTDGVVLVLKANFSQRETAHKSLQDFRAADVAVLGAVLNQRTFPVPARLYKIV